MLNQRAEQYLTARGLELDGAVSRGLHSATKADGKLNGDDSSGLLGIPYYKAGRLLNVKYRKLWDLKEGEDPWLMMKGGKLIFWNRDVITDETLVDEDGKQLPLIITEGEWDALAAIQAGFVRTVSVPNGATLENKSHSFAYLDEAWEDLQTVERVIIATDGDEAGHALREGLVARLGRARCLTVTYPKDCKDLGDALRIYGAKDAARGVSAVRQTVERARFMPMDGLFELHELPEEPPLNPLKLKAFGPDLEHHIGLCRGHLSFWTGEPGGGKTTLVRGLAWAAAAEAGWKTAAAFFEDKPRRDTVRNLKKLYANGWPEADQRAESERFIADHFKFIIKKGGGLPTVSWFLDQAEAAVIRHGVDLIIADPWSQFDLEVTRELPPLEAILQAILKMKSFAERLDVHVAVIAHPKKHGQWGGTDRMADGDAIAGSFHFRARCDLGVTVQAQPGVKYLTNVKVWKVRDREEQGDEGEFSLLLSPHSKRFSALHPDDALAMKERAMGNVVDFTKQKQRKTVGRRSEPSRMHWQDRD